MYQPYMFVPASCWLFRRELADEIGPWKFYRHCYNIPSQNWLHRAWKAGKKLSLAPELTVVAIHSGRRPNVYRERAFRENELYRDRILNEPAFRETELNRLTLNHACNDPSHGGASIMAAAYMQRVAKNAIRRIVLFVGLHPLAVRNFLTHRRKGGFISHLRRLRGLD
jgi:hypothetical protein